MKVFVTDGHCKHALAIIRSLGRRGVEVHVGSFKEAAAFYSKYITKRFTYRRFNLLADLTIIDQIEHYDVILPVTDEAWASLICSQFSSRIPCPSCESYDTAANKWKTVLFANSVGVPTPRSYLNNSGDLAYPFVVKACTGSGRSRIVTNKREFDGAASFHDDFVAQELIHGEGYGFFAAYDHGHLKADFMHRRVREVPASGGPSSCAVSAWNSELFRYGKLILDRLNWHGVAMVEFKREARTGRFILIEINPKFWGSLDLPIAAGVDFPIMAVWLALGANVHGGLSYRNIRYCWFPDDFKHVYENPTAVLKVMKDWFDPRVRRNVWFSDLKPHLFLTSRFLKVVFGR